jgi:hypothetical protein
VLRSLVLLIIVFLAAAPQAFAQDTTVHPIDYTKPSIDSLRMQDSLYRARKALLDKWVADQRSQAGKPQDDFLSISFQYGGLVEMASHDITQIFAERVFRPDPKSDADEYAIAKRSVLLSGQAQLAKTWGIYVEYDYTNRYSNVIVDPNTHGFKATAEEGLDLTEHSFIVGGMYILYTSRWYRLRLNGGIGGVIAETIESELDSTNKLKSRSASAKGLTINFDVLNDLRVMENVSFTIDLFTRSISTGKLTTSDDKTLDEPFGRAGKSSIAPTASTNIFGVAAGIVYYF